MLEVRQLRAGYGNINVLWDLNLRFAEGQLTSIIGPNGAGKTTLLKTMMGLLPATSGEILLNGTTFNKGMQSWDMVGLGLVLIPEGRMIFREMSVEENLIMGAFAKTKRATMAQNMTRAYALFPRLKERRKQLAGSLSGGEAQMLAIARGLMAEPQILLIDEPSLGLSPLLVQEIFAILRQLKQQGVSIVLVEQNTQMALALADQVCMMRSGSVVLNKPAVQVTIEALQELYFAA
jgi:branched-chain amino acid transport system ATP-binding protein